MDYNSPLNYNVSSFKASSILISDTLYKSHPKSDDILFAISSVFPVDDQYITTLFKI